MADRIEKIQQYIDRTPGLGGKMANRFTASWNDTMALAYMARETPADAVVLAIEYGRALGLRMGRREAKG